MKRYKLIGLAAILLAVTGCTENSETGSEIKDQPAAITIHDFADRDVTFNKVPSNIVALSNGDMDIIYALGGKVVGRPTSTGEIPVKEAESVEQIGSTHEVDLEKIMLVKPDVVLGNFPLNMKDIPTIEDNGAKMILTGANSIADIKKQIQLFGQLLQKEEQATDLTQTIDDKLAKIKERQLAKKPRVLMVYGAPGTNMAALPNSLSGNILELAGGENIASDFPSLQNFPQYAQLNIERIVESNPQFIVIMTHGNPEAVKNGFVKDMQKNSAWNKLDAVKNNRIEVLPSDLFGTNPGTRVTDAIDLLSEMLQAAK